MTCGVLALDEPTTNLDEANKAGFAAALAQCVMPNAWCAFCVTVSHGVDRLIAARSEQRNFQLIMITHDQSFVDALSSELSKRRCGIDTPHYYRLGRLSLECVASRFPRCCLDVLWCSVQCCACAMQRRADISIKDLPAGVERTVEACSQQWCLLHHLIARCHVKCRDKRDIIPHHAAALHNLHSVVHALLLANVPMVRIFGALVTWSWCHAREFVTTPSVVPFAQAQSRGACDFASDTWSDVTPVPQDDGDNPVVPIAYTEECTLCGFLSVDQPHVGPEAYLGVACVAVSQAMDYFRAILAKNELSERALQLTNHVIQLNPANYTAWHYRRQCLTAVGSDLREELTCVPRWCGGRWAALTAVHTCLVQIRQRRSAREPQELSGVVPPSLFGGRHRRRR